MSFEHWIAFISSAISFCGLVFVALQLRDSNRQRESESIVKLYDSNRELLSLGFSHKPLFDVLEDKPITDHLSQKRYLQLWLNQLALIHAFLRHAVVQPELQDELRRNLEDFMGMNNMRQHWKQYGSFYPDSFQRRVNEILRADEPPKKTAHPQGTHTHHEAKT